MPGYGTKLLPVILKGGELLLQRAHLDCNCRAPFFNAAAAAAVIIKVPKRIIIAESTKVACEAPVMRSLQCGQFKG